MTTSGSLSRAWNRRRATGAAALVLCAGAMLGMQSQPKDPAPPAAAPSTPAPAQGNAPGKAPAPSASPTGAPGADQASDKDEVDEPVETEITLKDGRRVVGTLVEQNAEKVVLSIGGIATTFKMDVVERVQNLPTVAERYAKLQETIDPEDVDGLMRLAEWLRAHGRYDFALNEVERALKIEPANPDARGLKMLIIEQEKIAAGHKGGVGQNRPAKDVWAPAAPMKFEFPLLTPEQINIIRVFEVNLKDPPRMKIERNTVTRFMDKYVGRVVEGKGVMPNTPEGRAVFYGRKPAEMLDWMFGLKAREFYGEVQVLENPRSMLMFRDHINRTWLVNSCATNNCHGGEEAGRLWLYNKRSGSDQAAYTNFLILDRFKLANGMPLISYAEPGQSPLLQMGLPQNQAVIKHPELVGANKGKWRAVFRSEQDEKFEEALEWIKAMYEKRPDYPVDYKPPVPQPKLPGAAPAEGGAPGGPGDR